MRLHLGAHEVKEKGKPETHLEAIQRPQEKALKAVHAGQAQGLPLVRAAVYPVHLWGLLAMCPGWGHFAVRQQRPKLARLLAFVSWDKEKGRLDHVWTRMAVQAAQGLWHLSRIGSSGCL